MSGFSTTCAVSGSNFTIRRALLEELVMFDTKLEMNGSRQEFIEDRALVLAYRRRLPVARQRVYYTLGCPVLHWIQPHKMKLMYLVWRNFAGGCLQVRIGSRATSAPEAMKEVGRTPLAGIRYVAREWWDRVIPRAGYARLLFVAAFHTGVLTAILRDLPARLVGRPRPGRASGRTRRRRISNEIWRLGLSGVGRRYAGTPA
jgi:hypothetical protein